MSDQAPAVPASPAGRLLPEERLLPGETEAQRQRLLDLRLRVRAERALRPTPAVDHALRLAEVYLQIGLGYCGHTDDLFPEEESPVLPEEVSPSGSVS